MSRKTNAGKKPILRDYGIQPYRACDKEYSDVMRTATFKAASDAVVIKESEFAKPYEDTDEAGEDYSGMEYFAPNIPSIKYPGIDFPGMGLPVPDFEDMYNPWHLIFHCTATSEDCYCEGDENCFNLNCTYEIIGVDILDTGWGVTASGSRVCLTAPDDESGSVEINVNMRAPRPWKSPHGTSEFVYGTHYSISISACDEKECCDTTSALAWSINHSDETIAQSGTAAVTVTGSNSPFTWSVSGTGFTLDYTTTEGLSNTLNADAGACGSATITVTGCDGEFVIGYVKCITGIWTITSQSGSTGSSHTKTLYYGDVSGPDDANVYWIEDHFCCDAEWCKDYSWRWCPSNQAPDGPYVWPCGYYGDIGCPEGWKIYGWVCA